MNKKKDKDEPPSIIPWLWISTTTMALLIIFWLIWR
jgi:hypothetical protein